MKIAILGHKRIPSREGGIEVVVEELAVRMAALGHSVTCYNRRGRHVSGTEFALADSSLREYKGVRLRWAPTIDRRGLAALTGAVTASFLALFGGFDIIHYHAEGPSIMCWLPKLFGKKVVVTVHGLDHKSSKWGRLASSVIRRGERNAVRYADAVIVLSESIRKYFWETYGRRTELIQNGASAAAKREASVIRDRYGLEKDSYILFLGRLVPGKGLDYLIPAYRSLDTDKKLVIAGGGSDSGGYVEQVHDMARGDDRILFTGFVQGELLEELYSNAYLYVLPSDLEGMPLSLLEAMSYGNCCVSSDIPECTNVTGEAGFSFPAGNTAALAALLQKLCREPETVAEYKAGAAAHVLQRFNWDNAVRENLALYERVLSEKRSIKYRGDKGGTP